MLKCMVFAGQLQALNKNLWKLASQDHTEFLADRLAPFCRDSQLWRPRQILLRLSLSPAVASEVASVGQSSQPMRAPWSVSWRSQGALAWDLGPGVFSELGELGFRGLVLCFFWGVERGSIGLVFRDQLTFEHHVSSSTPGWLHFARTTALPNIWTISLTGDTKDVHKGSI